MHGSLHWSASQVVSQDTCVLHVTLQMLSLFNACANVLDACLASDSITGMTT